jgi:tellurium resistance protein TerD
VEYTAEDVSGIKMINQYLLSGSERNKKTTLYKTMSLGFDTKESFTIKANVAGYTPMTILVKPIGEKVEIEIVESVVSTPKPQTAVNLQRGQKVSLTKNNPGINEIYVGLGWDLPTSGQEIDLDAQVFMLGNNGKVPNDEYFVFYNQNTSRDGAVVHSGDNKNGSGDGDDESLTVNLSKISPEIEKILFTVTIHEAKTRNQTFGQVKNAYIRIEDKNTKQEVIRFELGDGYPVETSLVVGELYKHGGEWKFSAVGSGYKDELVDFCYRYGVDIA